MGEIIRNIVAQHGLLGLAQYLLMVPLAVTGVLAGWRATANLLRERPA